MFAAEIEAARRTGNLGYMARILAQVTLPHSRPEGSEYVRRNGRLTLSVLAPSHIGLPYAGLPRIILSWLTTEAVRTRERTLVLGPTLSQSASSNASTSMSLDTRPVLCARGQLGGFLLGSEDLAHDGGSSPVPFLDGVGVHPEHRLLVGALWTLYPSVVAGIAATTRWRYGHRYGW
jgi:hypothetical protein